MTRKDNTVLIAEILEVDVELSLTQICSACGAGSDDIVRLVEVGALEPLGTRREHWRFSGNSLRRARTALRLQRDLGVNVAGAALALELLDELAQLRAEMRLRSG
jgi:chaperone modulatory protein CbpM